MDPMTPLPAADSVVWLFLLGLLILVAGPARHRLRDPFAATSDHDRSSFRYRRGR